MSIKRSLSGGYTLVEVMIVVTILGIVVGMGSSLFFQAQNFYISSNARTVVQRDVRASLELINRELRQAIATSIVIDTPPNQGYYSRITFQTIDGRCMQFYQNGNQLKEVIQNTACPITGGNQSVASHNLAYIAFTYPNTQDSSLIGVSLAIGQKIQRGQKKFLEMSFQRIRIMN